MVVGDIVSVINTAIGAQNFQPAAGVEIICLSFMGGTTTFFIGLTNGTTITKAAFSTNTSNGNRPVFGKHGITNTNYLHLNSSSTGYLSGFTGIQIK